MSTKLQVLESYHDKHLDSYWIVFDEPTVTRPRVAVIPILDLFDKPLPDHQERRRLAHQFATAPQMAEALEATNRLALELMERTTRLDRKLLEATKSPDEGVELGQIVRLRKQLGRNQAVLARSGEKG